MNGLLCSVVFTDRGLRGVYMARVCIPATIVIGKTQFCLSGMQYEVVNISYIYIYIIYDYLVLYFFPVRV